jgi:nucleolin
MVAGETDNKEQWKDAVLSILDGAVTAGSDDEQLKVKKLRKLVLLSLQQEDSDKAAKKQFKEVVQGLEEEGELTLDEDGMVSRTKQSKKRKAKEEKDSKKKKKKKHTEETTEEGDDGAAANEPQRTNEDAESSKNDPDKNKAVKGNPQGVTRLFLGNLPFAVDEASLEAFLPKSVTALRWQTDKETGKFYGSAFVEMSNSVAAADAVAMAGSPMMGRPVKINFAPSRPGDIWPPPKKVVTGGGGGGQAGGSGIKAMSVKPENCSKLFIGNVSFCPTMDVNLDRVCCTLFTHFLAPPQLQKAVV